MSEEEALPDSLRLEAVEGACAGRVYEHTAATALTIGRTKASSLHINDATVSERHGELAWQNNAWQLTDFDSSNGTAVNGATLEPHATVALKHGDLVRLGDSKLQVEVSPVLGPAVTVEQYLESECSRIAQETKAKAEQHANDLAKEWRLRKLELLAL